MSKQAELEAKERNLKAAQQAEQLRQQMANAQRMQRQNIAVTLLAGWGVPVQYGMEFDANTTDQQTIDRAFTMAEMIIKTGNTRP